MKEDNDRDDGVEDESQNSESEFVRTRVCLTNRHKEKLEECADEHHAGNLSMCMRSAIDDHARVLNGQHAINVDRVKQIANSLHEEVDELSSQLDDLNIQENTNEESDSEHHAPINDVHQALIEERDQARPSDLAETLDISRQSALLAAEKLVDRGVVARQPAQEPKYAIETANES
ncbi:helix-turn-helix domain-containing protein [Haloferax marisrubri]|uniref:MarR family transcriptional regulator n=1 Tax=Haloferax marisrubri TaxID=1544719 RepID=UPI000AB27357|nr:MarR family transcriptional regulator [Haloferax marisrubri]